VSAVPAPAFDGILKANDLRGVVPAELDETLAHALGVGAAELLGAGPGSSIVVGRDARTSSPSLAAALRDGITRRGVDVVDVGLVSTDALYFATGHLGLPGIMVTASHNPAHFNGFKLCRAGARPVGRDSGLAGITARATEHLARPDHPAPPRGSVRRLDVLDDYASRLLEIAPVPAPASSRDRRLRVVVDAANAMAGLTAPAVLARVDVEVVPMAFELDGRFPHHPPDPLDPANLVPLQEAVTRHGADLGLAFDGDADRCFFVDERGRAVPPSAVVALVARRELERHPGGTVVHSLTCSRVVAEQVAASGGVAVRAPVGHAGIKTRMAETGAVFGGEHSGHYYFAEFWNADSGMLAALHVLGLLASSGGTMSQLVAPYDRYAASGELNHRVVDVAGARARVEALLGGDPDVHVDALDGLTLTHPRWWLNLRASNTESLLRLNVEADDVRTMESVRDRVLTAIRGER
jgi:phosphomannomutase